MSQAVVILQEHSPFDLQKKVNTWIDTHKETCKVVNVSYTIQTTSSYTGQNHCAMILYERYNQTKEEKENG